MSPHDAEMYESKIVLKIAARIAGVKNAKELGQVKYQKRIDAIETAMRITSDLFSDPETVQRFVEHKKRHKPSDPTENDMLP